MSRRQSARRDDRGETLLELVITVAIIGTAVTAVLGAVTAGIDAASLGRKQADAKTFLRAWAEGIQRTGWTSTCASEASVASSAPQKTSPSSGINFPNGVGGTDAADVTVVTQMWNGTAWVACSGTPSDLQQIKLTVKVRTGVFPAGAQSLAVVVRKP